MRYMMLIYSQEDEAATPEEIKRSGCGPRAVMDEAHSRGVFSRRRSSRAQRHCHHGPGAGWRGAGHRWPIRRNQGAVSRILHPRLPGPRRSACLGSKNSHWLAPAWLDVSRSVPSANASACTRECMTTTPPSKRFSATSQAASSPALFAFRTPSILRKKPCRTPSPPPS